MRPIDAIPKRDRDAILHLYDKKNAAPDIARVMGMELAEVTGVIRHYAPVIHTPLNYKEHDRPLPRDFEEMAEVLSDNGLREYYGCGRQVLARWHSLAGTPDDRAKRKTKLTVPNDFVAMAPQMTKAELGRHYMRDDSVIKRWLTEAGVAPKKFVPKKTVSKKQTGKLEAKPVKIENREITVYYESRAKRAARWLQRKLPCVFWGGIYLYENDQTTWGDVNGLPHKGRDHYYVAGKGPMWIDDMVELAFEYGMPEHERTTSC